MSYIVDRRTTAHQFTAEELECIANGGKWKPTEKVDIEVGEIRAVSQNDTKRLGLVIKVNEISVEVCLLSNEIDMACDRDVLLTKKETGCPFDLIAERDIGMYVYKNQIHLLFGKCDISLLKGASHGTKIQGPCDPRWKWKVQELYDANKLSESLIRELLTYGVTERS